MLDLVRLQEQLERATGDSADVATGVLLLAPLPLVGLVALLVGGIANIQQRARYLVVLERELRGYVSPPGSGVAVPAGYHRAERAFMRSDGWPRLRTFANFAMGGLVHGSVFVVEIGLILYAVGLTDGATRIAGYLVYGLLVCIELGALLVALRPARGDESISETPDRGAPPIVPAAKGE